MANQQFTDQVTALIDKDISQAIKILSEFLKGKDTDLYHTVLMKSGAFNELEKDSAKGIIDYEVFKRERAKIYHALLYVVEKIKELPEYGNTVSTSGPVSPAAKSSFKSDAYLKGLQEQQALLIEKLTFYEKELAIISNAEQKFSLKKRIEDIKQELEEVDRKLLS